METAEKKLRIADRIEELARALSEELGEIEEGEGDCWFDAIEARSVAIGDALSAALMRREAATKQPPLNDETICPKCGKRGRHVGDRQRELITRRGATTIAEPEYYCPGCRQAFFPSDPGHRC